MSDGWHRAVRRSNEDGHVLSLQGHVNCRFGHEIVTDRDGFSQSVTPHLSLRDLQLKTCEAGEYLSPLTVK